jgi:hypothetical protein
MIEVNKLYYNKSIHKDIVNVVSVDYQDGVKTVVFTRVLKSQEHSLPLEMFITHFGLAP